MLQVERSVYPSLMQAWGRRGDVGEMRALLAEMRARGMQISVAAWTSLVSAYASMPEPGMCAIGC